MGDSIPYFRAEELAGIGDVLHEKLQMHPLDAVFPREVHDGPDIEIRIKVWSPYAADAVSYDEPTPQADNHDFRIIRATPVALRKGRIVSNSETSFFRSYGQIKMTAGLTDSIEERRGRVLTDIARESMLPVREGIHRLFSEALQGTLTYKLGGVITTVPYGLNALTPTAGNWDDPSYKIITELYVQRDAFEEFGNVPADTVIFNPRLWAKAFVHNTEFRDFVKENPSLNAKFIGLGDGEIRLVEPRAPFPFLGMTWVPVWGKYLDRNGVLQDRWPLDKLTFMALNAGDGQRVTSHAATRDNYTPNGTPQFRTLEKEDPIQYMSEYADNCVPVIHIQERVQTYAISYA